MPTSTKYRQIAQESGGVTSRGFFFSIGALVFFGFFATLRAAFLVDGFVAMFISIAVRQLNFNLI